MHDKASSYQPAVKSPRFVANEKTANAGGIHLLAILFLQFGSFSQIGSFIATCTNAANFTPVMILAVSRNWAGLRSQVV